MGCNDGEAIRRQEVSEQPEGQLQWRLIDTRTFPTTAHRQEHKHLGRLGYRTDKDVTIRGKGTINLAMQWYVYNSTHGKEGRDTIGEGGTVRRHLVGGNILHSLGSPAGLGWDLGYS